MKYKEWRAVQHARDVSEAHNKKVEAAFLAGFELAIHHATGLCKEVNALKIAVLIGAIGTAEVDATGKRRDLEC